MLSIVALSIFFILFLLGLSELEKDTPPPIDVPYFLEQAKTVVNAQTISERSFILFTFFVPNYILFVYWFCIHVLFIMLYLSCFIKSAVISYLLSYSRIILFYTYYDICLSCGHKLTPCANLFDFVCVHRYRTPFSEAGENGALNSTP